MGQDLTEFFLSWTYELLEKWHFSEEKKDNNGSLVIEIQLSE